MSKYQSYGLTLATLASMVMSEGTSTATGTVGASTPAAAFKGGGSSSYGSGPNPADVDNMRFARNLLLILASMVSLMAIYRLTIYCVRYIRTLTCLSNEKQLYFTTPTFPFASIKEHLFYAPLLRLRHNQEMQIMRGWSIGILPTRFQSLVLAAIIGMNVVLCCIGIEWTGTSAAMLSHLRNRTGTLAVVNMIPLVILAGRNNPLIKVLNISFDTFNLLHRWFGRIVTVEALVHTLAWTINKVNTVGWSGVRKALPAQVMTTGLIGTVALIVMVLQASSLVRHAFYEVFLHLHIALAALTVIALWLHIADTEAVVYLKVVVGAWAGERGIRLFVLIYRNTGRSSTQAILEPLPGDAVRVTLKMACPWKFQPGQHVFLTIPSLGLWTSHPFSVAWSTAEERPLFGEKEGLVMNRQDVLALQQTSLSCVIRRRDGFTDKVWKKAEASQNGSVVVRAFAEGPYGGLHSLDSYGTVMLFAGGVGITHQVPYVRSLVAGFANGTVAARRVTLIWIIQSPEHLEWIRPWMTTILALDRRRDVLKIQLFVTRPRSTKEIHSPSATVQMFPGRPNVDTLIGLEADNQMGAMGVSVCGPGGLSDSVREAVRRRQGTRNIDFLEESFSW